MARMLGRTHSPTSGQWEVYRCGEAESDQACGIRTIARDVMIQGTSPASAYDMVVSDTNREECVHMMRLADALHICALHNYSVATGSHVVTLKGDVTPEQFAKFQQEWNDEHGSSISRAVVLDAELPINARLVDAVETAWAIIANVSNGAWDEQSSVWRTAAEKWRDEMFHPILKATTTGEPAPLTAAEAVYGLLAWLTCRDEVTTLSAKHDASIAAEIAGEFCKVNNLGDVSSSWPKNLVHPPAKAAKITKLNIMHVATMPDGSFEIGGTTHYDERVTTYTDQHGDQHTFKSPTKENMDLDVRNVRQVAIALWAIECFGEEQARSVPQRALRLTEEAIEAAQAALVDERLVHDLVKYVYGRPVGEISQEIGGVGVTLLALAAAVGVSADIVEYAEVERILTKPRDFFTQRNALKNAAGFLVVK